MHGSVKKVEASRSPIRTELPKLQFAEKAKLLETYHPDFRLKKKEIPIGANRGFCLKELIALIESPSRLNPEEIDLKIYIIKQTF
jgi:hypothetical protein